jgi:hypothetical protein
MLYHIFPIIQVQRMFTFNSNIKNEAEKIYQNAMLMISGEKESDFMLENLLAKAARLKHPHAAGELGSDRISFNGHEG